MSKLFSLSALNPTALREAIKTVLGATKLVADAAFDAGKVIADNAIASQPIAAPFQNVADNFIAAGKKFTENEIDLIVGKIQHLDENPEVKTAAVAQVVEAPAGPVA